MKKELVILSVAVVLILSGCVGGGSEDMSVAEQAANVFDGGHSQDRIKQQLDDVAVRYNMEATEENRRKVADAAVAVAKNRTVTEMELLDCAYRKDLAESDRFVSNEEALSRAVGVCATELS